MFIPSYKTTDLAHCWSDSRARSFFQRKFYSSSFTRNIYYHVDYEVFFWSKGIRIWLFPNHKQFFIEIAVLLTCIAITLQDCLDYLFTGNMFAKAFGSVLLMDWVLAVGNIVLLSTDSMWGGDDSSPNRWPNGLESFWYISAIFQISIQLLCKLY